jgi:hypothetical protein
MTALCAVRELSMVRGKEAQEMYVLHVTRRFTEVLSHT